jgi:hypothetical protein
VHSVTADTNIYISGLNFSGPPRRFLNLARAGGIRLAISEAVMEETLRVLGEKFHWPEDATMCSPPYGIAWWGIRKNYRMRHPGKQQGISGPACYNPFGVGSLRS